MLWSLALLWWSIHIISSQIQVQQSSRATTIQTILVYSHNSGCVVSMLPLNATSPNRWSHRQDSSLKMVPISNPPTLVTRFQKALVTITTTLNFEFSGLSNPCWLVGTSEQEPKCMMVVVPSYFLVPVQVPGCWLQAKHRNHLNPAKTQVEGHSDISKCHSVPKWCGGQVYIPPS